MIRSFNINYQSINLALSQIDCQDLQIGSEEHKLHILIVIEFMIESMIEEFMIDLNVN